jgi:hypothetical protein
MADMTIRVIEVKVREPPFKPTIPGYAYRLPSGWVIFNFIVH